MDEAAREEFYVGYLPMAPPVLGAATRRRAALLVLIAAAVAAGLAAAQGPFARAVFEYGDVRRFEGRLEERPFPTLRVSQPGAMKARSRYLLVAPGKFGAAELVAGLDGHRVALEGTLIYRDEQTMLELVPGSVEDLGAVPSGQPEGVELGRRTLRGEIVDSKCFLGVMKPGNLKPHRACATRCISGGVPPVLLVRDEDGRAVHYLLAGADGGSIKDRILDRIAEPVEVSGRVERSGRHLVMFADRVDRLE